MPPGTLVRRLVRNKLASVAALRVGWNCLTTNDLALSPLQDLSMAAGPQVSLPILLCSYDCMQRVAAAVAAAAPQLSSLSSEPDSPSLASLGSTMAYLRQRHVFH